MTKLYEIEEEVVRRAYLCPRDHVCLTGKDGLYCKVTDLMKGSSDEAILVDCRKGIVCPYLKAFGKTHVCGCPVRREIHKRYGK